MLAVKIRWRPWQPASPEDKEVVRRELSAISVSPHFCNSKRYPAFLSYVVEKTLAGHADDLKERNLGVEVFQRPSDYDTHADTVVRYTAGEVRKRLSLYYHELDWNYESSPKIQISLPPGSYVPEFLCSVPADEEEQSPASPLEELHPVRQPFLKETFEPEGQAHVGDQASGTLPPASAHTARLPRRNRMIGLAVVVLLGVAVTLVLSLGRRPSPLETFWNPVFHGRGTPIICTGTVVFAQNKFSGTSTAGRDTDYPFVSLQQASAIGLLGAALDHGGTTYILQSAPSTPLSELRERPVVLLGGYNNDWTFHLQEHLRYQFLPEPDHAIVDTFHSGTKWSRDQTLPYSNSDDYALIARYSDSTTDGVVVILAGVGRNGTEAAAQFVTSPHYMQLLADKIGPGLADKNLEVVLKISVIEGKTGAPTIEAVHVW
jgi:hypothetical protein